MAESNDGISPGPLLATSSSSSRHAGLHLACRECQRKKIKCDRSFPCGRCARSNLPCVPSSRKPRAKVGAKAADVELRQRIAKLEKLVESFQGDDEPDAATLIARASLLNDSPPDPRQSVSSETSARQSQQPDSPQSPHDAASPHSARATKYIAGDFWSSLTTEVKALADAFEEDGLLSDEDPTSPEHTPDSGPYALDPSHDATAAYELIFCPPGALYVMPGVLQETDPAMATQLINHYLQYVEPPHKLFHVPSLRAFLDDGQPYLGKPADALCNKALRAALLFAGVNALTPDECMKYYRKTSEQLVLEYKRMVDIALYQADPLNTIELATVQALVLYAAAIRVSDSSRRAWSLVGLLVRIGRALNLHRESHGESAYVAELRRRIWYNIVFLDCYSSLDRGSESALQPESFSRLLPSNCNDTDFDEKSASIPRREGEITDTSLSLIAYEGSVSSLRMASPGLTWQRRLEISYEFQRKVNERFLRHCNPDIPFHKVMLGTGTAISHSMILRAVRPIDPDASGSPPRVDSPWVMQLAMNILRHSSTLWLYHASGWRRMPWVPWHAIAVALAGLCSVRGTEMADEAWQLVEMGMSKYAVDVADSKNGMLWRPIEKLYKKAVAFRDAAPARVPTVPLDNLERIISIPTNGAPGVVLNDTIPPTPGSMLLDPMNLAASDTVFDFHPNIQATLPNDTSWLDWEAMMRDMDEIKADDMQWM